MVGKAGVQLGWGPCSPDDMAHAGGSAGEPIVVIPEAEVTAKAVLGEPENGTADQTGLKWPGGEVSAGGETGRGSSCSICEDIVDSSGREAAS